VSFGTEFDSLHLEKFTQTRQDIKHNSQTYLSNTPGGLQASASHPPDLH